MSLQVWLPLNGNLENLGLADVTVTNHGATVSANGKIGSCYTGTDANDTITATWAELKSKLANGNCYSVAWWVKMTDTALTVGHEAFRLGGNVVSFYWGNNPIRFVWNENNNGRRIADGETTSWHHLVVAIDKTTPGSITQYNYMDGQPVPGREAITWDNSSHLEPSGTTITFYPYMAYINDFRIYDHLLSRKEVKELAKGLIGHWPLNDMIGGENLILNSNAVEFNGTYVSGAIHHWGNWSNGSDRSIERVYGKDWFHFKTPATTTYGGFHQDHAVNGDVIRIKPNTKYTVSATWFASEDVQCIYWFHWRSSEGGANLSQSSKTFTVTIKPQRVSFTFTSDTNATYTVNRFNLMMGVYHHSAEGVDVYFTDVKMEEGEIATPWIPNENDGEYVELGLNETTVYDCSGYCHHGVNTNTTADGDAPRYSVSTKFDGSNYITLTNSSFPTVLSNDFTLSMWIHSNDDGDRSLWFGNYSISGGGNFFGFEKTTGDKVRFWWNSGNPDKVFTATSVTKSDGWVLLTIVKEGNVAKIYRNGVLSESNTNDNYGTISLPTTASTFRLGADGRTTGNTLYKGSMSDVRIYATALSEDDIKELYETSASVDNNGNFHAYEISEL